MKTKSLFKKCAVIFILFLGVIGATNLNAQETFTVGDLNYQINDDGISVTVIGHVDGENAAGELIIPSSITYAGMNLSVTAIADYAFVNCNGFIGSLTIPNSIIFIGDGAFWACGGFNGLLTIGNSVTEIGYYSFSNTSFIGDLIIPNSVTKIFDHAFSNCHGFNSLIIGDSVEVIGDQAFQFCWSLTGSLTIPNSVSYIGDHSFLSCWGFNGQLTIGNSVTYIGNSAFENCNGFIGSLTIPNSVTYIGDSAFQDCTEFDGSLTISNSVTHIGDRAFFGCNSFTGSLTIPDSVTSIGFGAFNNCYGFNGNLTIGSSVNTIGEEAFYVCMGITSVISLATVPPMLINDGIGDQFIGIGTTTLIVPCGYIPAYQSSDWSQYFTTFIEDCSDVSELDENLASVYPNPTKGIVKIEGENIQNISIYNMQGEMVFESSASGNEFYYDFSNNESGVYLVRIGTSQGIFSKRITVM